MGRVLAWFGGVALLAACSGQAWAGYAAGKTAYEAGDYATALMFMGMGFSGVSVAPNFVPQIRWAVRETPFSELQDLAQYACEADSGDEVRDLLERVRVRLHDRQEAQTSPAETEESDQGSLSS